MKIENRYFCNFTTLLSIFLIIYILIDSYFEEFNLEPLDKTAQFFLLALVFFLIFFKIYKNTSFKNEKIEKEKKIINENQSLKTHSHIDSLTQCLNQKHFLERFDEEIKRAIREKQYISLVIVNVDEFKAFNDIYGQNEGDECLKIIANILVNNCNRPVDLISRFKSDEFYILLPNTKEPETISKKCVHHVKSLSIPHENSIASNVLTISIGVSTILANNLNQKDELIKKAIQNLKNAKRAGRNQVISET